MRVLQQNKKWLDLTRLPIDEGLFSAKHVDAINRYGLLSKYALLLDKTQTTEEIFLFRLFFDSTLIMVYEWILSISKKDKNTIKKVLSVADGSGEDTLVRTLTLPAIELSLGFDISKERVEKAWGRFKKFAVALSVQPESYPCKTFVADALKMNTANFIATLDENENFLNTFDLILLKHPDPYDWLSKMEDGLPFNRFKRLLESMASRLNKDGIVVLFIDKVAWIDDKDYKPFYELICQAGFNLKLWPGTLFGLLGIETNKNKFSFTLNKLEDLSKNTDSVFVGKTTELKRLIFLVNECAQMVD